MANGVPELPHILLNDASTVEEFTRPGTGGSPDVSRVPNREQHARRLLGELGLVLGEARISMQRRSERVPANANGYYLRVESRPNEPLYTQQFEGKRSGVELLSVKVDRESGITTASLFVPERSADFLEKKIEVYETKTEPRSTEGMPKFRRLVEGIDHIYSSALAQLWIDTPGTFPARGEVVEWEVWLRPGGLELFQAVCQAQGIEIAAAPLEFPEDQVI